MSGNADRNESGQFESTFDDEEVLEHFADGRPFHTAQEIADRFDVDRSTAYRRLSDLATAGALEKVTLGSRTVVWWYPTETSEEHTEAETDDPLFTAPAFTIDEPIDEDDIDDVLYGELEG
ncbi:helix-turn-helix domain-containing protein [Natronorubrum sp. DTA28]|uniref:helix-turn-helix domain-containing protein n=1 Tax=Natronorubrum sp. DTA28 TaxID=3447019 RepID=UPI003F827499